MKTGMASAFVTLTSEAALETFGEHLACLLSPGDVVMLEGTLGVGKTTLARALLRRVMDDEHLDVPSPTFSFLQAYESASATYLHLDLYRLLDAASASTLAWESLGTDAYPTESILLVEWPDVMPEALKAHALLVQMDMDKGGRRRLRVSGNGRAAKRAERFMLRQAFLAESLWSESHIKPLAGDASSRVYFRLEQRSVAREKAVLVDSPRRPDGPALRHGKPYSALVHLAEDVRPFVAVADYLRQLGLTSPALFQHDLPRGFLLTSDLGTAGVAAHGVPHVERYEAAIDVLVHLHQHGAPEQLPLPDNEPYAVPVYDKEALQIEAELFLDWYLPHHAKSAVSARLRAQFVELWHQALLPLDAHPRVLVLRDYHSPNLIWRALETGLSRVGLLDFQDAVAGSAAYDVASLAQDARVSVPEALELALLSRYVDARTREPDFDREGFLYAYAVLAAQRATKILGIFVRLSVRDGKDGYLAHMPRVKGYLLRALRHPSLHALANWFDEHGELTRIADAA